MGARIHLNRKGIEIKSANHSSISFELPTNFNDSHVDLNPPNNQDEISTYLISKKTPFNRLHRAASGWRDVTSDLSMAKETGTAPPTWSIFKGGIFAWKFSASVNEELQASFHINHDFLPLSKIYPHIHWCPTDNSPGIVRWGLEMTSAKGHSQQSFPNTQTIFIEQAANGAFQHQIAEINDSQAFNTNLEPDSLILIRIFRDATHVNDTYASGCFAMYLDIHYQSDRDATSTKAPAWDI